MNKKKVLVAAPISSVKQYCILDWMNHISNLSYENYDILLVDNSQSNGWHLQYKLEFPKINFLYFNPKGLDSQAFIAACQEKFRKYAYLNDYDYIISIECDVFPPLDIIERLLSHNKPIVGGIYSWGFNEKRQPLIQVSEYFDTHFETRNLDFDEAMMFCDGSLKQVHHIGLGCLLIHRNIFKKIPFRYVENDSNHSDSWFAFDCSLKGINIYADTSILCRHENQSWGYQSEITKSDARIKIQ